MATTINLGKVRVTDKGEWSSTYEGGYDILDIVTFEKGSYMSKVSANSAALTDRDSWVPIVDTEAIDVSIVLNEETIAAALLELASRVAALEKIISSTLRDRIDVTEEFNVWGKTNLILTGSGASASAPDFVGQIYVDTTGGNVYVSVGTANAGNWKLV